MEDKVMDTKGTSYNFAIIIAEIVEYDRIGGVTVRLLHDDGNECLATLDDSDVAPLTDEQAEELRQRFKL